MRKLLIKALIFAVPILILLGLFESRLCRIPTTVGEKKARIEAGLADWETIILGSSYAYRGFDPHYLSSRGVNAAAPGQSLYFDSAILLKYLPLMPKLKTVIFTCPFFGFEYSTSDNPEYWRKFFYRLYYGMSEKKEWMAFDLRNFSWFAFYGNRTSLDHLRTGFHQDLAGPIDELGWIGGLKNTESELTKIGAVGAKQRMDYQMSILKPSFAPRNRAALENALHALKKRGIRAVIVAPPAYQEYTKLIPPYRSAATRAQINELVQKYGVLYLDLTVDPRFTEADFLNNDHLNEKGAEKLTRLVDEEIRLAETRAG